LNLGIPTADFKISRRNFAAVTFLASGALAWFFVIYSFMSDIFTFIKVDTFWFYVGQAVFVGSTILSVIVGAMIAGKINVKRLLWAWIALGVLTTSSLLVFQGIFFSLLVSVLLGVSFGLGLPCSLGFLLNYTASEGRGRAAGAMIFETFALAVVAVIVSDIALQVFASSDMAGITIVLLCIGLRSISIIGLVLTPFQREPGKERSWKIIFGNRTLILYLIPWIMFNIAVGLMSFVTNWIRQLPNFTDTYKQSLDLGNAIHFLMPVFFALISGFVADRFGRKQPVIFGMIILGASFALLVYTSPLSLMVYLTLSGVAWGFLTVVYFTVPGDLAYAGSQEKFYALCAILPFIINLGIGGLANFSGIGIPAAALSSILTIIIFASIIPVLRAPETLSESVIREKEAKEHVKKVEKLVEESRKKSKSQNSSREK